jgi:hypothetical protein
MRPDFLPSQEFAMTRLRLHEVNGGFVRDELVNRDGHNKTTLLGHDFLNRAVLHLLLHLFESRHHSVCKLPRTCDSLQADDVLPLAAATTLRF